jgi:glycine betaine/choline ABC-type transport system substrate-binding protein
MNRPDGYPGLVKAYELRFAERPREMDRNLLYQALAQGSLDLAAGDSTDGRIAALDLVQLDDDRHYFPPYQAVPLVRAGTLERFPRLKDSLNRLAGQINAAAMREMNRAVDQNREKPEAIARRFLLAKGLLGQE